MTSTIATSSRVSRIASALNAAASSTMTFADLPLGAQTKVVNSVQFRVFKGAQWWNQQLSDESNTDQFRKRAASEVNARERCIPSLQDFLTRASHFSSGVDQEVARDTSYADEEGISGDIEYVVQTMSGNPYAWAKASLMEAGCWNEFIAPSDEPLAPLLFNVEKVYTRFAARYAATCLLIEFGLLVPRDDDTPSDMVMIAALSQQLKLLSKTGSFIRLFEEFKSSPFRATQYVDGTARVTQYTQKDLVDLWRQAIVLDREDAEAAAEAQAEADAKAERKALVSDIRSTVRTAVTAAVVMQTMTAACSEMKSAGVADEAIQQLMAGVMAKLGVAPAPATQQ